MDAETRRTTLASMRRLILKAFLAGWFGMACMGMFVQDYLGKTQYIAYLHMHWVDMHWGWGLTGAAFCLFYYYLLVNRYSI